MNRQTVSKVKCGYKFPATFLSNLSNSFAILCKGNTRDIQFVAIDIERNGSQSIRIEVLLQSINSTIAKTILVSIFEANNCFASLRIITSVDMCSDPLVYEIAGFVGVAQHNITFQQSIIR